ncbi:hypothetical protein ACLQ28_23305 [Micromonospora sp. DT201]
MDGAINAYADAVGLRRRKVLGLGLRQLSLRDVREYDRFRRTVAWSG